MSKLNCPHCNTHIDEHPASRCLDAWVAEAVMGLVQCQAKFHDENPQCYATKDAPEYGSILKEYSTDIAAAWEVVEKLRIRQSPIELHGDEWHDGGDWQATFYNIRKQMGALGRGVHKVTGPNRGQPSAPLAICRAAIKASA